MSEDLKTYTKLYYRIDSGIVAEKCDQHSEATLKVVTDGEAFIKEHGGVGVAINHRFSSHGCRVTAGIFEGSKAPKNWKRCKRQAGGLKENQFSATPKLNTSEGKALDEKLRSFCLHSQDEIYTLLGWEGGSVAFGSDYRVYEPTIGKIGDLWVAIIPTAVGEDGPPSVPEAATTS